jgi:hypothetical protein
VKRFFCSQLGPSSLAAPKLPVLWYICIRPLAADVQTTYHPPAAPEVKKTSSIKEMRIEAIVVSHSDGNEAVIRQKY